MTSHPKLLSPLRVANNTRPRAELVKDLSIPHGHECTTGAILRKVWQMKNSGQRAWPKGSLLLWVDGPVGPVLDAYEIEVPVAEPGELVKIAVQVVAPKTTGYHTGTYRLCDEKRRHFGPWLEVELSVYDPSAEFEEYEEEEYYDEEEAPQEEEVEERKEPVRGATRLEKQPKPQPSLPFLQPQPQPMKPPEPIKKEEKVMTQKRVHPVQPHTAPAEIPKVKSPKGAPPLPEKKEEAKSVPGPSTIPPHKGGNDLIQWSDIRWGAKIGQGSFGEVYKGTLWGQDVAIKRLRLKRLTKTDIEDFHQEVEIMRNMRHPNIVEFLGVCNSKEKGQLCIVTEYLVNGSLEDMLQRNLDAEKKMSIHRVIEFATQVAKGLNWLHHKGIIHRDLKTANILVDKHNRLKIADFGLAHVKSRTINDVGKYGVVGTPCYMAPEVLKKSHYGVKADVFSFGIILSELLIGDYPFDTDGPTTKSGQSLSYVDTLILKGDRPVLPDTCPPLLKALIQDCWKEKPEDRPTVDELVERLEKISKAQGEVGEDLLEDLPEKVVQLLEEDRRRVSELEETLKQTTAKVKKAERALQNEAKLKAQVERNYKELKKKYEALLKEVEVNKQAPEEEEEEKDPPRRHPSREGGRGSGGSDARAREEYKAKLRNRTGTKPAGSPQKARKAKQEDEEGEEDQGLEKENFKPRQTSLGSKDGRVLRNGRVITDPLDGHFEKLSLAESGGRKEKHASPRHGEYSHVRTRAQANEEAEYMETEGEEEEEEEEDEAEAEIQGTPIGKRLPKRGAARK